MIFVHFALRMFRRFGYLVNPRVTSYASKDLANEIAKREVALCENPSITQIECRAAKYIELAASTAGEKLRVIDFGGSGGRHGYQLPFVSSLEWSVIETAELAEAMSKKTMPPNLSFYSNIQEALEALGGVDVVHVSSAIQYTPQPTKFLDDLLKFYPELVILEKLVVSRKSKEVSFDQFSSFADNLPGGFNRVSDLWKLGFVKYRLRAAPQGAFMQLLSADYQILETWVDVRPSHLPLGLGLQQIGLVASRRKRVPNWS